MLQAVRWRDKVRMCDVSGIIYSNKSCEEGSL